MDIDNQLYKHFFKIHSNDGYNLVFIFYCEFTSKRAPSLANVMKSLIEKSKLFHLPAK